MHSLQLHDLSDCNNIIPQLLDTSGLDRPTSPVGFASKMKKVLGYGSPLMKKKRTPSLQLGNYKYLYYKYYYYGYTCNNIFTYHVAYTILAFF